MPVLLVTGAGRGIGAAIARLAGRDGWDVAVNYSRAEERAREVVGSIRALGRQAVAIRADVSDEADVERLFAEAEAALGPIGAVVNNAAIDHATAVADSRMADVERVFRVNIYGPWMCARAAIRRMATSRGGAGGVIVNVSSISARTGGLPNDVIYAASKGALDSFSLGLAKEVGDEGIRVVAVRPGITRTEIFDHLPGGLARVTEVARANTALGRIAEAEEVAELVAWLCSSKASYMTATAIDVSAGR